MERFEELVLVGLPRRRAEFVASLEANVSRSALAGWRKRTRGLVGCARLAALLDAPGRGRKRREWTGLGADELWTLWCTDYLRPEAPDASAVYRRLSVVAEAEGWELPPLSAFRNRTTREVSRPELVRSRLGAIATMDLAPHQTRTVGDLAPLQIINGDGKTHDVVVGFPSGRLGRPVTWYWQDVYSRRILAWASGETESSALIRRSLHDIITRYGVPDRVVLDNTRAASAKELTGRLGARKRNRAPRPADELPGILHLLGIDYSTTTVDTDAAGRGAGRGRAKPVERAFGDLVRVIDTHPLLAGAYTGRSPRNRPETHRERPADWETFLNVVAACVREHNARPGRRTEAAAGRSLDETWTEGLANTVVRRITAMQARIVLLSPARVRVARDGTVTLRAGSVRHRPANRYYHPDLLERVGQDLVARFDPDRLHDPIQVFDEQGRWIVEAKCLLPVGWRDVASAREYQRLRRQMERNARAALERRRDMDSLLRHSIGESEDEPIERRRPATVRLVNGPELPDLPDAAGVERKNRLLTALRKVHRQTEE